jgi:hypothetical protein
MNFKKRAPKAFEAGNSNKSVDFPLLKQKTHSPLHSIEFFFKAKDVMDRSVWQ